MPDLFDASRDHQPVPETPHQPEVSTHHPHRPVEEYSAVLRNEPESNGSLQAFVAQPSRVHFDIQHTEEKILLLLRRHPVTQLPWMIAALILAALPLFISGLDAWDFLPIRYQLATLMLWYLFVISFVLENFLSWFYNVNIITDERIIDVDFLNILYKNISAAKIDNIEDVSAETGGVFASMFDYGTVKIQTAGTVNEFEFEDVPQPAKITALLNELILEEEREKLENRVN